MALEPSHPEHSCSLSSLFSELCQEHSCAICGQVMIDPRVLDCQHSFCFRCLFRLNLRNRESDITIYCPFKCGNVTRLHGTLHALPRNYTLSNTCSLLRDHSRRGKTDLPEDSSGASLPCEWCSDSPDEGTCVFCSTCRSWLCSKCNNRCGDHAYLCKYADASSIHSADKIKDVIPFLFPESAARKVIQQQSKFYGISDRDGHANVGIFPARLQCTEGHFTAMSVDDTSVSLRLAQPFSFSKEDLPPNFRSHRRLGDDGTYPLMILAYAIKTCEKLHGIVDVLESGFGAIKRHSGDSPCFLGMKEALCCAVAAFRLHALMVIIRQQYLPLLELLLMIEFHISETTIQRLNYKYAHVITPAERKAVREHSLHFSQTHYTIALSMKEAVTGAAQDVETLHQILNWLMSSQDGSNDDDDEGPCDGEVRLAAMKKFDDAVSAAIDRVVADTAQLCRRVQSFRLYAFAEGDLPMERMEAMEVWADEGRRQTVRFLEELTNGLHDWDSYFTTALSLSPSDARRRIQHAVQAVLRPTSTETPFSVDECDVVEWFQLIVVRRQLVQVGLMGDAHFSVSRDLHFHDSWLRSMQQLWEGLCHALQSSTIRMPKAPRWEKGTPLEEDTNRNSSSNSSSKVVAVETTDHSSEKCTYYHTEVDAVNLLLAQQNILSQLKRSTTYSLDMEMRQLLHDPLDVAAPSAEAASNAPLNVQIIDAIMATSRIMSNQTDPDARSDGAHVPTMYLEEDDGTLFVMAQRHFRDLFESSPKELMQTIRKHVSIPVYIGVVSAQKKSAVFIFDAQTARTTLQVGSLPPPISLAMILESPLMKVGVSVAIVISAVWGLVRL